MIIRKQFDVEMGHVVRNCSSERCSHSQHGHSAVIEILFESRGLDNAQMVIDFGLMKDTIKGFIDSMDHCYMFCRYENEEFKNFHKENNLRWIETGFNPTAEMISVFIFDIMQNILENTKFNNGEGHSFGQYDIPRIKKVRYHETKSGYAECDLLDWELLKPLLVDTVYSDGVMKDWSDNLKNIMNNEKINNPVIKQQIKLK